MYNVAWKEKSLLKLKLVKNYLRKSMCQEPLSDLAIILVGKKICKALDHNEMTNNFASVKVVTVLFWFLVVPLFVFRNKVI